MHRTRLDTEPSAESVIAMIIMTTICFKSAWDVKAVNIHWLTAWEQGAHILPECPLHSCPSDIPRSWRGDPGNESGYLLVSQGDGRVDQMAGSLDKEEQPLFLMEVSVSQRSS